MVKFTSHSRSSGARLEKLFLLLGLILLLAPAASAFASPASEETSDPSGVWEITIHDPGGWLAEGMSNGKYWQTAETWETKNGKPIMTPQDYPYSMDLLVVDTEVSGTYKNKEFANADLSTLSDEFKGLIQKDMTSGELSGSIKGNQITLKMGTFAELSGTVTGTSMQGSGTLLHYRVNGEDENNYTDFPDRPVTFSGTLAEAAGSDCQAIVSLPKDLKPGDDLSPAVVFKPIKGYEKITPLSIKWFFNGKEANSIVWDGKYVEIELQYTCPNHMPHSEILDFAAYKEITATKLPPTETPEAAAAIKSDDEQKNDSQLEGKNEPEEQTEDESSTTDLEAVGTVAVVAGGALTVVTGAVGAGLVIKGVAGSTKVAETVASKPGTKQTSPTAQRERLTPQEKSALREKISRLEQKNLENMRQQENLRVAQKTIYQCKDKMARVYKKNLIKKSIKVMMKTVDTVSVMTSPVKTAAQASKAAVETAMTYIEGAWDAAVKAPPKGASDGEILQNQRENLSRLNDEVNKLRQMRNQNKNQSYRNEQEIEEIKRRIADAIEVPYK